MVILGKVGSLAPKYQLTLLNYFTTIIHIKMTKCYVK
jgi:hypothetical protein